MIPTRYLFVFLLSGWILASLEAQYRAPHDIYWLEFKTKQDKDYPYSIFQPQAYLSPRALERRRKQGILIDSLDLPVPPRYLRELQAGGYEIHAVSKWFNSAAVYVANPAAYARLANFDFIQRIEPLGPRRPVLAPRPLERHNKEPKFNARTEYHGAAANQAFMLGVPLLHARGYAGQGLHLAIFDGGFTSVDRMPAFDSLHQRQQILGTHDFVQGDTFVYESSNHGTNVLATMGSNIPYLIVGTSPEADYYLFKTEDVGGEFRIEEFNWTAAIERADSLGVDLINSSLGYTKFNDTLMSYRYAQLNGETALCTRAADIAVRKGVFVVNSAGNEGNGDWHYIGAPADGKEVLAVGATRGDGVKANFSSFGPSYDGRIKPNVAAQGQRTTVAGQGYDVTTSNGTSFSGPVMAGAVASLWTALPELNARQLRWMVQLAGHQASQPDSALGFGIPNLAQALLQELKAQESFLLYLVQDKPNQRPELQTAGSRLRRVQDWNVFVFANQGAELYYRVYNTLGQEVYRSPISSTRPMHFYAPAIPEGWETWPQGTYTLRLHLAGYEYYHYFHKE